MPYNVHYSHVTLCCVHSIQQSLISSPLYRQATLESLKKIDDFKRNKVFSSKRSCRLHHFITYWVTSNAHNRVFFLVVTCLSYRELDVQKSLEHKSEVQNFSNFSVRIILDVLFRVFSFSKASSFNALTLRS